MQTVHLCDGAGRTGQRSGLMRLAFLLAMGAALLVSSPPGLAAPTQRYAIDDHGDFVIFGNTAGFDCRDGKVEKPVVGSVPVGLLGLFSCNGVLPDSDTGVDILFRSDYPATAQATAANFIDPSFARSTAVLALPTGAQVVMARLYWAAQRSGGQGAGTTVTLERPNVFSRQVTAQAAASKTLSFDGLDYYQSSADITDDVRTSGAGAYRVGGIQTVDIRTRNRDVAFVAWNIVVFYHLDSAPVRNLALHDGLERVSTSAGSMTNVSFQGFSVPANGFGAKLGVIAYEGDNEITGDQLLVNGTAISGTHNPASNFFNRSSTVLDVLAPRAGDLPQMSGRPSSMSGYDSDIIDITARLTPGATQLNLSATTSGDEYFLGVFATAVTTIRPVFTGTQKQVRNVTRSDGRFLPGDTLEYTISTRNSGNDIGKNVTVTDVLPAGLTFVPGSLVVTVGDNLGVKTDMADADQGEYVSGTRTITMRLGNGANGTMGGDMAADSQATFRFRVTIDANAQGTIVNQASISSLGATAQTQGVTTPTTWQSSNGTSVPGGTPVVISTCNTNADCGPTAPICDTTATPRQCICQTSSDCGAGRVCDPGSKSCVQCIVGVSGQCSASGPGGQCLSGGICGCTSDSDCNGRRCDLALRICQAVPTDLTLAMSRNPGGGIVPPGSKVTYALTVANAGGVAVSGAALAVGPSPSQSDLAWTCTASGGATCPAAMGQGPIATTVDLPAGGKLNYTLRMSVSSTPASSTQDFTASITPPVGFSDSNPADNFITDSVLVSMPPLGPDLSITVREEVSDRDNSVAYVIDVTNRGDQPAPGATLYYDVPAGTQVQIDAGEGWQCALSPDGTQVMCSRTQPIPPGPASPVRITVTAPTPGMELPLVATVAGTDESGNLTTDPNPADNTVDRKTVLNRFKLEGGGIIGCRYTASPSPSSQSAITALAALLGLVAWIGVRSARRLRRQQDEPRA
jgi:uncharacterized repeat protein (TIGR01451 family)